EEYPVRYLLSYSVNHPKPAPCAPVFLCLFIGLTPVYSFAAVIVATTVIAGHSRCRRWSRAGCQLAFRVAIPVSPPASVPVPRHLITAPLPKPATQVAGIFLSAARRFSA